MCACVLFAGTVAHVQAREPGAPDEAAISLDQAVQALKDESIQFNRDAQMAQDEFLYPPQTHLSVFVSNRVENLLLDRISVSIDGGAPVNYVYDELDSRALLEDNALQRLVLANVARGPHRITAVFSGHFGDAKDGAKPVTDRFEAVFDKGLEAAQIELVVLRGARRNSAVGIRLKEWIAASE